MILSAYLTVKGISFEHLSNIIRGQTTVSTNYFGPGQTEFKIAYPDLSDNYKISPFSGGRFEDISDDFISEAKCKLYAALEKEINEARKSGADVKVCLGKVTQ